MSELRYAIRSLRKSPGFTVAALLTLAVAIGANSAIFSAVYGVLLRPLPMADPERLAIFWDSDPSRTIPVLFGVTPLDAGSFGAAIALVVLVVSAASFIPARRAASIEPLKLLGGDGAV